MVVEIVLQYNIDNVGINLQIYLLKKILPANAIKDCQNVPVTFCIYNKRLSIRS